MSAAQKLKPAISGVDASDIFPDAFEVNEVSLPIPGQRNPLAPTSNIFYFPENALLRRCLAWAYAPVRRRPLGLVGETGTGKSEMAFYLADKLNMALHLVKIHGDLNPAEFECEKQLVEENGQVVTREVMGAAVLAYRDGGILLLDELDKANESLQACMHLLLEGKPWPLESGVVIYPHPECRIICTANTTGSGDSLRYTSSNRLDQALRSRIGWLRVNYPSQETEHKILNAQFAQLPLALRQKMQLTAIDLRKAVLGPEMDGNCDNPIGAVFSTRVLVDWCFYTLAFGLKAPIRDAYDFVFGESVDDMDKEIVDAVIQRRWDKEMALTTKEVVDRYAKK